MTLCTTFLRLQLHQSLFAILCNPSFSSMIRWQSHGRSFVILDRKKFAQSVLPVYFRHSNISSFLRQVRSLMNYSADKTLILSSIWLHHKAPWVWVQEDKSTSKDLLPSIIFEELASPCEEYEAIKAAWWQAEWKYTEWNWTCKSYWRKTASNENEHILYKEDWWHQQARAARWTARSGPTFNSKYRLCPKHPTFAASCLCAAATATVPIDLC